MNRLTKKDLMNTINHTFCSGIRLVGKKMFAQIIDELCEYKTIEEELGIELRVYHKLMSMLYCSEPNILYIKDKDKIVRVSVLEINYCKKKIIFYKDSSYNDDYVYGFIQYGKTWALTREELGSNKNGN